MTPEQGFPLKLAANVQTSNRSAIGRGQTLTPPLIGSTSETPQTGSCKRGNPSNGTVPSNVGETTQV